MEDQTVTGFDDVTTGAEAQPETTTTDTAAEVHTETQPDQATDTTTTTEDFSDEDLAWAQKKGVNLEDKKAVAKMLRNADQKVSEVSAKAKTTLQDTVEKTSAVEPNADVVTQLRSDQRILETRLAAMQYYNDNPDDRQLDAEASAILQETLVQDPDLARGLGRNLPALFALAKQRHSESEVAQAKEAGRKEERTALAGKQRASATSQAATTSSTIADDDPFLKGFMNK